MNLEQCMEKQLSGATPMARLFPHTDLHIFTKGAYNHKRTDSKLSTDGSHGTCGLQQHASAYGLTIDGAITLTTLLPLLALVCELTFNDFSKSHTSDKQIKEKENVEHNVSPDLMLKWLQMSKYYTIT